MTESRPICFLGDRNDLCSVYLKWLAEKNGFDTLVLDESEFGVEWTFRYDDPSTGAGRVRVGTEDRDFGEVMGAVVRFNPRAGVPASLELDAGEQAMYAIERRAALQGFANRLPCPVVNRTFGGRSNGSKPYQMRMLASMGFRIPEWIVTNRMDAARAFLSRYPDAVYKSCSGLRSQVRRVDDRLLDRLARGTTPVILQEYVAGADVRIHVAGRDTFATEVTSQGIDYRFENEGNTYQATSAPRNIEERCVAAAAEDGLLLAGCDFKVTGNGDWYCLEMNPVPTFLPYEMETGQQIAASILRILADAASSRGAGGPRS